MDIEQKQSGEKTVAEGIAMLVSILYVVAKLLDCIHRSF